MNISAFFQRFEKLLKKSCLKSVSGSYPINFLCNFKITDYFSNK